MAILLAPTVLELLIFPLSLPPAPLTLHTPFLPFSLSFL